VLCFVDLSNGAGNNRRFSESIVNPFSLSSLTLCRSVSKAFIHWDLSDGHRQTNKYHFSSTLSYSLNAFFTVTPNIKSETWYESIIKIIYFHRFTLNLYFRQETIAIYILNNQNMCSMVNNGMIDVCLYSSPIHAHWVLVSALEPYSRAVAPPQKSPVIIVLFMVMVRFKFSSLDSAPCPEKKQVFTIPNKMCLVLIVKLLRDNSVINAYKCNEYLHGGPSSPPQLQEPRPSSPSPQEPLTKSLWHNVLLSNMPNGWKRIVGANPSTQSKFNQFYNPKKYSTHVERCRQFNSLNPVPPDCDSGELTTTLSITPTELDIDLTRRPCQSHINAMSCHVI